MFGRTLVTFKPFITPLLFQAAAPNERGESQYHGSKALEHHSCHRDWWSVARQSSRAPHPSRAVCLTNGAPGDNWDDAASLISGALGAAGEDYLGDTAPVGVLYVPCVVGLAPMRPFAWISRALGLAAYPVWDFATLIAGLLAVPATWYVIFLGVGHVLDSQRRAAKAR